MTVWFIANKTQHTAYFSWTRNNYTIFQFPPEIFWSTLMHACCLGTSVFIWEAYLSLFCPLNWSRGNITIHVMSGTLCVEAVAVAVGFLTENLQTHCEVCVVNMCCSPQPGLYWNKFQKINRQWLYQRVDRPSVNSSVPHVFNFQHRFQSRSWPFANNSAVMKQKTWLNKTWLMIFKAWQDQTPLSFQSVQYGHTCSI